MSAEAICKTCGEAVDLAIWGRERSLFFGWVR